MEPSMRKHAILTGGTGFIGSNLCKKLIKDNWDVSIITKISSDCTNIKEVSSNINIYRYNGQITNLIKFFKKRKTDVVFHLASSIIIDHESTQIDALVESNLRFGLHILEAMKESNTKLIINAGTSWQHYHVDEYNPVNLYAATKEAYEKLMKYYVEAEGIRAITLKLFDTYGETDRRPKLINLLYQFADNQQELKMSPGNQVLDLIHIDDVTSAFVKAYDYLIENVNMKYEDYGVGSGSGISIKKLIQLYEELSGKKINIKWGGREYRKREVMNLWSDYQKLPNWECHITLSEGLLRYINKNSETLSD
jgi:nucleoside-diphosphate-sugar epimerase